MRFKVNPFKSVCVHGVWHNEGDEFESESLSEEQTENCTPVKVDQPKTNKKPSQTALDSGEE